MTDTNADMDVKPDEQPIVPAVVEKRDDGMVRPGDLTAKLQACRDRAELDQDQAGIAMRLSPAMIKALETENFAELPDPPYVRGYLRSYARLDESDPQDLIRTYELLRGADPDSLTTPPPISLTRVQHKQSISPTTIRMLGLVALVLLLGVLSMIPGINQWVRETWHSFAAAQPGSVPTMVQKPAPVATTTPATGTSTNLTASEPVPATTSPALASTTQDNPVPTNTSELVQPSVTPANTGAPSSTTNDTAPTTLGLASPATSSTTPATPTGIASTDPALVNPTSATSTPATTTPSTSPATETAATTSTPASTTTTPTLATGTEAITASTTTIAATDPAATTPIAVDPNKPADATATTQQPIDGEVTVRMEFTQEVWMQVRDGTNKAIFESLNSPNTWKQFKTRTPLTFKIGNAPGVKLYLNGQAYDHAKYTRGSVARFTVN